MDPDQAMRLSITIVEMEKLVDRLDDELVAVGASVNQKMMGANIGQILRTLKESFRPLGPILPFDPPIHGYAMPTSEDVAHHPSKPQR